jgi:hypothetical protein
MDDNVGLLECSDRANSQEIWLAWACTYKENMPTAQGTVGLFHQR